MSNCRTAPTAKELAKALGQKRGPEASVQQACLDWLNTLPNCRFYRRNVGGVTRVYRGKSRFIRFGKKGMSDLWGVCFGLHTEIEIKQPGEEPTPEQFDWLREIAQKGGMAFWADSLEMCQRELKREFERKGLAWHSSWEL